MKKYLSVRTRMVIILVVTFLGLLALLYTTSRFILLNSYTELEKQDIDQNVQRVQKALEDNVSDLNALVGDWAPWSDSFNYVMGTYDEYPDDNLMNSTFTNLGVNFMIFINTDNQVVGGKGVDMASGEEMPVPDSLLTQLLATDQLINHSDPNGSVAGFIMLPSGPMYLSSRPIMDGDFVEPIVGSLIMGQIIDEAHIAQLADETRLSLILHLVDDPELPADFKTAYEALLNQADSFSRPLNDDIVAGYTLFNSIDGKTAFIVRVDKPRDIYQQGQTSLSYLLVSVTIVGLVFVLLIGFLLEKQILSRLAYLGRNVRQIGTQQNLSARVVVSGHDEVKDLATDVNDMLSALEKADRQVRESEERLHQVVTSVKHHIYTTEFTRDGQHLSDYLSPNIEELTGYPLKTFMENKDFWAATLIHPDDQPQVGNLADRFSKQQDSEIEYRLLRSDGSIIWVLDSGRVVPNPERDSFIVYGVISDITGRKKIEAELAEAHEQALEASRLKTQLLANVSHDLRTPLNGVMGYAEMLQMGVYGDVTQQQHEALDTIIVGTNQLLGFVGNLINQAQIETGKIVLKPKPFSIKNLLEETTLGLAYLATSKGLNLTYSLANSVPESLTGDPYWLRQILHNLISNGLKFTETGSVNIRTYLPDAEHWAIEVRDTGPGISAEAQQYIFDAFRQVDSTNMRQHDGVGLGLSIVSHITTTMNSQLSLTSKVGEGSSFTVTLPLETELEVI